MSRNAERKRQSLRATSRALPSPDQLLALPRRRFDETASRLQRALAASTETKRLQLRGIRLAPALLERRLTDARRRVARDGDRLPSLLASVIRGARVRLDRDATRVTPAALLRRMEALAERLSGLTRRAKGAAIIGLERRGTRLHRIGARLRLEPIEERQRERRRRLEQAGRLLETVSYQSVLRRGFALVRDRDDRPLKRAGDVPPGAELAIEFADGRIAARDDRARPTRVRRTNPDGEGGQESLF